MISSPVNRSRSSSCSVVKPKPPSLIETDVEELPPDRWRQTVVQRAAAIRVDVDAVALEPVGTGLGALIDGDRYSGAMQPLRQAETTYAATDDHDVELVGSSHACKFHTDACTLSNKHMINSVFEMIMLG